MPPPPLFQAWHTPFCLMLSKKQWTYQFYLSAIAFCQFSVKSILVSLLFSLKSTVFFLLSIIVSLFSSYFTDALPLISGRGLDFCARASRADRLTSWPPHIQYASAAYEIMQQLHHGRCVMEVPALFLSIKINVWTCIFFLLIAIKTLMIYSCS